MPLYLTGSQKIYEDGFYIGIDLVIVNIFFPRLEEQTRRK